MSEPSNEGPKHPEAVLYRRIREAQKTGPGRPPEPTPTLDEAVRSLREYLDEMDRVARLNTKGSYHDDASHGFNGFELRRSDLRKVLDSMALIWQAGYDACELEGESKEYGLAHNPFEARDDLST